MSDPARDSRLADDAVNAAALPLAFAAIGAEAATQMIGFWAVATTTVFQAWGAALQAGFHEPMTLANAERDEPRGMAPAASEEARSASSAGKREARADATSERAVQPPTSNIVPLRRAKAPAASVAANQSVDDLKAIGGVGPKLEQMLHKLGVRTYAQIAAWSPSDVERIEGQFGFPGRISRDGWIDKARTLAARSA